MRSEKPICAPPCLSEVSPTVAFETVPMFVWLTMALSHPFKEDRLAKRFQRLSLPGDRWCDVLGFVPAGSVSSSSTFWIFQEASHLWGLFCLPVYLLGCFPSIRHAQGSIPTGVFKGGCQPLTHSSLGFPFHFSLFVASSLNLMKTHH